MASGDCRVACRWIAWRAPSCRRVAGGPPRSARRWTRWPSTSWPSPTSTSTTTAAQTSVRRSPSTRSTRRAPCSFTQRQQALHLVQLNAVNILRLFADSEVIVMLVSATCRPLGETHCSWAGSFPDVRCSACAAHGTDGGNTCSRRCTWSCGESGSRRNRQLPRKRSCTCSSEQRPGCAAHSNVQNLETVSGACPVCSCAALEEL